MIYKHNFVNFAATDEDGNVVFIDVPQLRHMERLFAQSGRLKDFKDYVLDENALWNQHQKSLDAIDSDMSFQTDEDAIWKREGEKYRIQQDFKERIYMYRNLLISSLGPTSATSPLGEIDNRRDENEKLR